MNRKIFRCLICTFFWNLFFNEKFIEIFFDEKKIIFGHESDGKVAYRILYKIFKKTTPGKFFNARPQLRGIGKGTKRKKKEHRAKKRKRKEIGSEPNLKIKKGSGPEPFWKHSDPIGFAKVLLLIGWAPEPTPPNRNRFRTELENKKGTPARNPTGSIRTPSASQRNCCSSTGLRDRHPKTEIGPEQNPQTKNSAPTK